MPTLQILGEEDFRKNQWSGGLTKQLYIYPPTADYQARDFAYRLSVASVDLPTTPFTPLPTYHRLILTLDKPIGLENKDTGTMLELPPFSPHFFEGNEPIQSHGQCQDFNLIYNDDYEAKLVVISNHRHMMTERCSTQMIYALTNLSYQIDGLGQGILEAGQLMVLEGCTDPLDLNLLVDDTILHKAIWVGLEHKISSN